MSKPRSGTVKRRKSPGPTPARDVHPVDLHVGRQIRMRRIQANLGQRDLSTGIGVSSQQLQKYETGRNRVSASMLYTIAGRLDVPVATLFDGLPSPVHRTHNSPTSEIDARIAYVSTAQGRALIETILQLSPRVRSRICSLLDVLIEG